MHSIFRFFDDTVSSFKIGKHSIIFGIRIVIVQRFAVRLNGFCSVLLHRADMRRNVLARRIELAHICATKQLQSETKVLGANINI